MFQIRPYSPTQASDLEALYSICLATGDNGNDASQLFSHPKLIGDFFAVPYAVLEPNFCFLLKDAQGVCGYIVGALDTDTFNHNMNSTWLPKIRPKYPKLDPPKYKSDLEAWLTPHLHTDLTSDEELADYPSHLHIDLLPRAQHQGQGKRLMHHFWEALTKAGSKGIHLGVSTKNTNAIGFYKAIGFQDTFHYKTAILMTKAL